MPFTFTVEHGPEYVTVTSAGFAALADLCGLFDLVRVTCERHGHTRALLDLRQVEIQFAFTDHLALGAHAASALRSMGRVASVVAPKFRVGTSEKAAQQMGLRFRTFTDLSEAIAWLGC
ncbi:STAS/SEC14 domain-containing protein [Ramlibacter sp. PS3R-8]|uniref:STAS/SEC14 domain-containing protein n=1 Tax=Ramlibacter sp. PS3R-8 TaxID=3133437 RepID=UPI0030998560